MINDPAKIFKDPCMSTTKGVKVITREENIRIRFYLIQELEQNEMGYNYN